MSADALPYTLLIILAEFTIGGLWALWLADLRGSARVSVPDEVPAKRLLFATAVPT